MQQTVKEVSAEKNIEKENKEELSIQKVSKKSIDKVDNKSVEEDIKREETDQEKMIMDLFDGKYIE